jgi:hypothetical protein
MSEPGYDASRYDCEGDDLARQFFTAEELRLSPEEYAARQAHRWGCFALHLYRYRDAQLGAWVRRFHALCVAPGEVERCRQAHLTEAEIAQVRLEEDEPW